MLADVMRNQKFGYVFSFFIGIGLAVMVLQKDCKSGGTGCKTLKAPNPKDIAEYTYIIGSDCYKFSPRQVKCPEKGDVIESFKHEFRARDKSV